MKSYKYIINGSPNFLVCIYDFIGGLKFTQYCISGFIFVAYFPFCYCWSSRDKDRHWRFDAVGMELEGREGVLLDRDGDAYNPLLVVLG